MEPKPDQTQSWVLPRIPTSHNTYLRLHWAKRSRENKAWRELVLVVCGRLACTEPPPPEGWHSTLRITVYRNRLQDPDNAVASLKPLIDAVNRSGWLCDDSEKYLTLIARQEKCPPCQQRTEITWIIDTTEEPRA